MKKIFKNFKRRIIDFYHYIRNFRNRDSMYSVKNGNTISKLLQDVVFYSMQEQYAQTISKGVTIDENINYTGEYIWICWFQGEDNAPDIVKACIKSVRKNFPNKKIIILTNDNIKEYVEFPEYIIRKREQGIIPHAQYSDLLRIELLCKYGGWWLDSTVLCTSNLIPESVKKAPFFVFKSVDLSRRDEQPIVASNWCILSSDKQSRILLLTRELLFEYWKDHDKLDNYFIFHIFFALAAKRYSDEWKSVPVFNNHSPHILQFELFDKYDNNRWNEIVNMSWFHKLNHHHNYLSCENTFYNHIIEEYLIND